MYSNMTAAEVYRREAKRLRTLSEATTYGHVRDGFLEIARQYELLAKRADYIARHDFGRSTEHGFRRRPRYN